MEISQFTEFTIQSETLTVDQIIAAVGLQPDRFREPPRPGEFVESPPLFRIHSWTIEDRRDDVSIGDQLERVLGRLRPIAGRVRTLVDSGEVIAQLSIYRTLGHQKGDDVHRRLGWSLTPSEIATLATMGDVHVIAEESTSGI